MSDQSHALARLDADREVAEQRVYLHAVAEVTRSKTISPP